MVELDPAVLVRARLRVEAFVVLAAAVVTWFVVAPHIHDVSLWPAVVIVAAGVLPATLGLILLALPLARLRWQALVVAAAVLVLVAYGSTEAGWHLVANFAKLCAYALAGWAFLRLFEEISWVVLVAVIIPIADSISVFLPHGPTHEITTHHIEIYNGVAVLFLAPGGGGPELGPPDILFYALFLGAAARFRLRPFWTWVGMTAMYALTIVLTIETNVSGLPALPFVSFGFLVANADVLWRRLRKPRDPQPET